MDSILKDRNNLSLKQLDHVKSHEMNHHQDMFEKENFHPKSLKEIAASSQTAPDKSLSEEIEKSANETFTQETEFRPSNTTFDQISDDDSYISTNESLGFLTEGFNNIKLDEGGQRTSIPANSTMNTESQGLFEPAIDTTLTIVTSPISESSDTLTGDSKHDIVQSPQSEVGKIPGDDIKNVLPEVAEKVDTLDEITALLSENSSECQHTAMMQPISPLHPSEIPSQETNISSPVSFEKSQETNSPMPEVADNQEIEEQTPNIPEVALDGKLNAFESQSANLTVTTPMEIDEIGDDITDTQELELVTEVQEEVEKPVPQQIFKCDFVSESALNFEFKTPQVLQPMHSSSNSQDKLELESPPVTEVHQSPETENNSDEFKIPSMPKRLSVEKFESAATYNFGNFDLDILQKFGSNSQADFNVGRDSVLLKFDPLLEKITPVEQLLTPTANATRLTSTKEEDDEQCAKGQIGQPEENLIAVETFTSPTTCISSLFPSFSEPSDETSAMKDLDQGNETIESVHVTKEFKDLSISDKNQQQEIEYNTKMTELESQLREAEIKEETLLKRITEKEKQMAMMNNVVKEYEKAIAELIAEKEQLIQSYEKKCVELKSDSETNSHHLGSLESTFSDLHAKYERTKQMAAELKEREESIMQDRKALQENLKLQEVRYEKIKSHAMSQLEIANNKLAEMQRNHQAEVTKLKAQLKKEEISRASCNEQLIQKTKENAELVKICDELIGNHGHSQNA